MDNSCRMVTGLSLCNHCIIYEQLTKLNSGCDDTHKCSLVLGEWVLAEKGGQVLLSLFTLGGNYSRGRGGNYDMGSGMVPLPQPSNTKPFL